MANLLDQQGVGQADRGADAAYAGQDAVFGGGGTYRAVQPPGSPQNMPEQIMHMAVVPIWMARSDSAVPDRYSSDDSIGAPNQPVYGGDPAPSGLTMEGMYDPRLATGRKFPLPPNPSPPSTIATDALGQLVFWTR